MNIDRLVEQCYNALPPSWKNNPWSYLDHGKAILDSDDKLNAYIASYGEMHIMKCRLAMNNIPFDDLESQDFEIFDWGCGQGLGTCPRKLENSDKAVISFYCNSPAFSSLLSK